MFRIRSYWVNPMRPWVVPAKSRLQVLAYLMVTVIILNSGSMYRIVSRSAAPWLLVLLGTSILTFFAVKRLRLRNDCRLLFALTFSIILPVHLLLRDGDPNAYFGLIIVIISTFLVGMSVPADYYWKAFINVVCFLAATSLIIWTLDFIGVISIWKFRFFPDMITKQGVRFYNFTFLIVNESVMRNPQYPYSRNASIFWEGGAFQAFLNIAFIMNLVATKRIITGKNALLFLTILTTFSTTGYVIIAFILVSYGLQFRKVKGKKYIVLALLIFVSFALLTSDVIKEKLTITSGSFIARGNDVFCDVNTFLQNPLSGCGIDNINYRLFIGAAVGSSGLTRTLAHFGLFLGGALLLPFFFFRTNFKWWTWSIVISLMLLTEDFTYTPTFLYLLFSDRNTLLTYRLRFTSTVKKE